MQLIIAACHKAVALPVEHVSVMMHSTAVPTNVPQEDDDAADTREARLEENKRWVRMMMSSKEGVKGCIPVSSGPYEVWKGSSTEGPTLQGAP
jgi:hypothetical protein